MRRSARRSRADGVRVVLSDINLEGAERVAREIAARRRNRERRSAGHREAGGLASASSLTRSTRYGALHYAVNNAGIGGAAGAGRRGRPRRLGARHRHQPERRALRHALSDPGDAEGGRARLRDREHGVDPRHRRRDRQRRLHGGQARRGRTDQERRGRVRTAGPADQLRRPGLHRDAAAREAAGRARKALVARIRSAGSASPTRSRRSSCFLLSDEASFMTGGYYLVDGGYTAV